MEEYKDQNIRSDALLEHLNDDFDESNEQSVAAAASTFPPESAVSFSAGVISSSSPITAVSPQDGISSQLKTKMANEKKKVHGLRTAIKRARIIESSSTSSISVTKPSSVLSTSAVENINISDHPRGSQPVVDESKENTNKLLRIIIKQNKEVIHLLRTLAGVHSSVAINDETRYIDCNGDEFVASEIPRSSPNVFAIQFLKRILGVDFKNIIVEPHAPSNQVPLDSEHLQLLKDALSKNFSYYEYSKVRHSVNQAARDACRQRANKCT